MKVLAGCLCWAVLAGCGSNAALPPGTGQAASRETKPPAGGNIEFVTGFERAAAQAQNTGKPLLVFFTATWCDYCQAMAREALCQSAVVKLSEQFTCVWVDAGTEPDLCARLGVRNFPTIQFFSPRGAALNRATGKQAPHQLVREMQAALQAVARRVDDPSQTRPL